jgi:hypothetical protein
MMDGHCGAMACHGPATSTCNGKSWQVRGLHYQEKNGEGGGGGGGGPRGRSVSMEKDMLSIPKL